MSKIAEHEDKTFVAFAHETHIILIPFLYNSIGNDNKLTKDYILDLFSNANRRYKEGKINDAILCLHRLVEMALHRKNSTKNIALKPRTFYPSKFLHPFETNSSNTTKQAGPEKSRYHRWLPLDCSTP
jgi:hypothetical protein